MKKLLSLVSLLFCIVFASAATVNIETTDNVVYLENTTAQIGTSAKINVMLKAVNTIGSVKVIFDMPEGVTIDETPVSPGAFVTWNENEYILVLGKGAPYYSTGVMATLNVNIAPTAKLGENEMKITYYSITEPSLATYEVEDDEVVSTLTIQKSAVLEPQDNDFAFDILPAQISSETTYLPILMKNKLDVASYTLEITYPEGISPRSGRGVAPKVNTSNLYSTTNSEIKALSVSQAVSGKVAKYTVSNDETDTYMAKDGYYEVLQVPVTVSSTDAICNIKVKVSDIVAYDADNDVNLETPINIEGGEFMTTLIIGQPKAEEAILYGHFTSDAASTFTTALKNVAFANTTAATFAEGALLEDVILTKDNTNLTFYTRTSENYGTTVLPYDLEEASNCTLYTVKDISSESIVIEETDFVAANTPCIFKGTITAYGEFVPTLGAIDDQIVGTTTFKGTYSATNIASGAGYYISSDGKFYGDGATVRPFRGYFEGTVSGVKSFSVLIDTPDGLKDITDQFSKEDIYNLQGIRMNNVQKGINIKGGKKVLFK